MKKNNDSIELESNSKQHHVKVNLTNLLRDPSLRKNEKGVIIILMIETKYDEHLYKKELVNPLTMIFQESCYKTNCELYLYVLEHNYIFVEFIHLFR